MIKRTLQSFKHKTSVAMAVSTKTEEQAASAGSAGEMIQGFCIFEKLKKKNKIICLFQKCAGL